MTTVNPSRSERGSATREAGAAYSPGSAIHRNWGADFGTGYSNFDYLPKLPARAVKLDRSFVGEFGTERPFAGVMIGISHDLGLRVVAEGVETQATLHVVRAWDFDEVQGSHWTTDDRGRAAAGLAR